MIELPLPTISWGILAKIAHVAILAFYNRLKIDITFDKTPSNPSIVAVFDVAQVRYQLLVRTHGWPKIHPEVIFTKVKDLGEVKKKAVSPSGLGEINGSLRLKLYTKEVPSESEIILNVDFEISIDTRSLVTMNIIEGHEILDQDNSQIKVLCTNKCDFPLEQIYLSMKKSTDFRTENFKVFILDKISHNRQIEVDPRSIRKGDDYVKWATRLDARESLLFEIVASAA